jgi:PKD repeat protein
MNFRIGVVLMVAALWLAPAWVFADVIPAARRVAWSPGIPGGIRHYTNIVNVRNAPFNAAGDGVADDSLAIQTALNGAQNGQVVYLPAGTYRVSSTLSWNSKSVALRGDGPALTRILSSEPENLIYLNTPTGRGNWVSVSGDCPKDSTNLTLASASGFSVGDHVIISQLNDPGYVFSLGSEGICTYCSTDNDGEHVMTQVARVLAKTNNTIYLNHVLYFPLKASLSPVVRYLGLYTQYSGIEDLYLEGTYAQRGDYSANIYLDGAAYCWVTNVTSRFAGGANIRLRQSYACEISGNYISDSYIHTSGHAYGISLLWPNSDHLIQNNIAELCRRTFVLEAGGSGVVFAYNLGVGVASEDLTFLSVDMSTHGAHPCMNLFEGNVCAKLSHDYFHGSSSHNTSYRCWIVNASTANTLPTYGRFAVDIQQGNYSNNVVGCVIGQAGDTGVRYLSPGQGVPASYRLGYFDSGSTVITDTNVQPSTYLHGNFDFIGGGTVWDPVNADHSLPASLYLSAKPAWFGDRAWPPFDPAHPSSAAITNIPAGYRAVFGTAPPSGPTNLPPVAAASASPTNGVAPLPVAFSSAGSRDPEGAPLTYIWTFGDGTNSTAANPTHTYAAAGFYTARLTVSDGTNSASSANLTITATLLTSNRPPVALASASPTNGVAPLRVAFIGAYSYDPEGTLVTYTWTFGDGTNSTSDNPYHTYGVAGVYSARLTVSDGTNSTASSVITITVVATSGLVAAYGFEEGSGGSVADLSGYRNTGTLNGPTWVTTGRFGKALSFDGTGAAVMVDDSSSLDFTTGMTLEAWVNPATVSGWREILYKGDDLYYLEGATTLGAGPASGIGSSGFIGNMVSGPTALPLNTWSHVAGTYDGATLRLYVDGTQVASQARTGAILTSTLPLSIGGDTLHGTYFSGLIDEVRIYNRALSQGEIQADMAMPIVGVRLLPLIGTTNGWKLGFSGTSGVAYQVQRAVSLFGPWTNVANVTATNSSGVWVDIAAPATQAFYRVKSP